MALQACTQRAVGVLHVASLGDAGCERRARVVKRYGNRKLYDTVTSRYVKLEDIAEWIRLGVDVQVVDHRTGRDLTTVALAHIIFAEELKEPARGTLTLTDVLRSQGPGSPPFDAREMRRLSEPEAALDAAERRVQHLLGEGHRMRASASTMAEAVADAVTRLQRVAGERLDAANDVVSGLARIKTELSRIERRIDLFHEQLRELDG